MNRTMKAVLIVCAVVLNSTIWLGAMAGVAYGGRLYMVDREGADLQQKLQDEYNSRKSTISQCLTENRGEFSSLEMEIYVDSLTAVGMTEYVDIGGHSIEIRTSETFFNEVVRTLQSFDPSLPLQAAQEASDVLAYCASARPSVFDTAQRLQDWIDDRSFGDGWVRQRFPTGSLEVKSTGFATHHGKPALEWLLRTVDPFSGGVQIGEN